jgi:putative colanic acid biosynthesis acetyltransferase WcaF
MPRTPDYRAQEGLDNADAYTRPAFSLGNRVVRQIWNIVWLLLYRPSPRPMHAWRANLLRAFGATLGPDCHFYPDVKIWAPWNLICEDHVAAGDGVEIYNPSPIHLDSHVILSQGSYLCGATHDADDPAFPLLSYRMHIKRYAWICARASVSPGVTVGEGAVLGLASVAVRDLADWTIYGGNPAAALRERARTIDEAGRPLLEVDAGRGASAS